MILNFGSINVDMIMQVQKLPTPGDTILCKNYQALPGGKGANQAAAASVVGSDVIMFGQIGNDEFGQISLNALKERGVETKHIEMDSVPTGCASISVDQRGENIIAVASGANSVADSAKVSDDLLTESTTILLQMEVDPKQNWDLLKRAKKKNCRTILNLAPAMKITQEALKSLSYLVVNEVEARYLGKELQVPTSNLTKLAEFLAKKYNLTAIITRGPKGAIAFTNTSELWEVSAMRIRAVDTTGAGDTFVGILGAILDQGKDIQTALHYAIVGSGLCCLKEGAQPSLPTLQEIEESPGDCTCAEVGRVNTLSKETKMSYMDHLFFWITLLNSLFFTRFFSIQTQRPAPKVMLYPNGI